jgi:hypothetical protein
LLGRRKTVPINVDFAIHRYGEWIMLMLGESVLSLLIVEVVDTAEYYKAFIGGILSITLGQYLHFHSAPSDPDQHAIRRSVGSSFVFYWLFQAYSLALIVLGVSYKMSLLELVLMEDESDVGSYRRRGLLSQGRMWKEEEDDHRWLAATGTASTSLDLSAAQRQQRIAHLFSASMAVIFFCSDAMSLAHRGIWTQIERCGCADTALKKMLLTVLVACRAILLVFIASLSQFVTDPSKVISIGTLAILAQVCVRLVGGYVFHDQEKSEMRAIERSILYNQSRIHDRPGYSDSARTSSLGHSTLHHTKQ